MANQPCTATIRGLPHLPHITEINVRSGPGTSYDISLKGPVGMSGLEILEVRADEKGSEMDGKIYQWFKLVFHGGAVGWVRDDLLEIEGDGSTWGYPNLGEKTFAFALERSSQPAESQQPRISLEVTSSQAEAPASPHADQPAIPADDSIERVKKASFRITAAFEGSGYDAYNNYDAGIVSYGLIQFTLAAGSLFSVVDKYLANSHSQTAGELRNYSERIRSRDESLRSDQRLKQLLLDAAKEPAMRQAQENVATEKYWNAVVEHYIAPRGLQTPLAYALLFDMGVNFGTGHGFVRKAEDELGVPQRSRPGENGITEEQLVAKIAELRKQSHYRQAERDHLPGLKARGDFWVNLIAQGDWNLMGDASGSVSVSGRLVQVRQP